MTVKELIDKLLKMPQHASIGIECKRSSVRIDDVDWGVSKKFDVSIFIDDCYEIIDKDYQYDDSEYWEMKYKQLYEAVSDALMD